MLVTVGADPRVRPRARASLAPTIKPISYIVVTALAAVFFEWLSVNSWGKSEKNRIRVKDKRWLASCRLFIIIRELVGKYMKDTVSESIEILVTVSDSFKYFDFVVTAFGKAVCNR